MQRHIHPLSSQTIPEDRLASLLQHSLAAVLRGAQDGNLPLFTWTLGLPQQQLLTMLAELFPELANGLEPLPNTQYAHLLATTPVEFGDLVSMLCARRTPTSDSRYSEWLARVVAAASFGDRRLWENMELRNRKELDDLLATCFLPLYRDNSANLGWKHFLLAELAKSKKPDAPHPTQNQHDD